MNSQAEMTGHIRNYKGRNTYTGHAIAEVSAESSAQNGSHGRDYAYPRQ